MPDVVYETHIEHPVSLVENEVTDVVERDVFLTD
jgi:hypothetical protein